MVRAAAWGDTIPQRGTEEEDEEEGEMLMEQEGRGYSPWRGS